MPSTISRDAHAVPDGSALMAFTQAVWGTRSEKKVSLNIQSRSLISLFPCSTPMGVVKINGATALNVFPLTLFNSCMISIPLIQAYCKFRDNSRAILLIASTNVTGPLSAVSRKSTSHRIVELQLPTTRVISSCTGWRKHCNTLMRKWFLLLQCDSVIE